MYAEAWYVLENGRVYSKRNMKFAMRQKDKTIHLDMKKNECNPITLERRVPATSRRQKHSNWTDSSYRPLGSHNPAGSGCCSLTACQNSGGQCRTQGQLKTNWLPESRKSLKKQKN